MSLIDASCNVPIFPAQIIVGDQMTCKNIRSARSLVQAEISPVKRLKWANEVPGIYCMALMQPQ